MGDILLKHNPKVIKTESNPLNYTYLTYSDLMLTSVPDNSPTGKQNPGNSAPDLLLTIQSKLSLRLHRDWGLLTTHSHSRSHATCGLAQPPELQSVRLQTSEGAVLSTTNNINNAHVSIRMDHDLFSSVSISSLFPSCPCFQKSPTATRKQDLCSPSSWEQKVSNWNSLLRLSSKNNIMTAWGQHFPFALFNTKVLWE